jgi:hypothetical protein
MRTVVFKVFIVRLAQLINRSVSDLIIMIAGQKCKGTGQKGRKQAGQDTKKPLISGCPEMAAIYIPTA